MFLFLKAWRLVFFFEKKNDKERRQRKLKITAPILGKFVESIRKDKTTSRTEEWIWFLGRQVSPPHFFRVFFKGVNLMDLLAGCFSQHLHQGIQSQPANQGRRPLLS